MANEGTPLIMGDWKSVPHSVGKPSPSGKAAVMSGTAEKLPLALPRPRVKLNNKTWNC